MCSPILQSVPMSRPRFLPDNFTLALIATVLLATFLPCSGQTAVVFEWVTNIGIGLLFFLHGAKLSRQAIIAGMTHWRLHLLVFACTFVMFPLLGLALKPALSPMVTPELYLGILFLCALPATVQSSIAFTSLARGNVPAAVCSASVSSLLGVFLTPLLVKLLLGAEGETGNALDAIGKITLQLLVPFIAGQVLRRWIGTWVERNKPVLRYVDQGSILLVVYTAFSAAVIQGLWHEVPWLALLGLTVACCVILALALVLTTVLARRLGFSKEDEITIVFCGSKKSLATGVPMAKVLFATSAVGPMVLPLMLFHQIQLMVCAVLAQRYARRRDDAAAALAEAPRAERENERSRPQGRLLRSDAAQRVGVRRVTNSSAAVGWMPMVSSNACLVAPAFIATAIPWRISPASAPTMWQPSTLSSWASTTSFIRVFSWSSVRVSFIGRKRLSKIFTLCPALSASSSVRPTVPMLGRLNTAVGINL